MGFSLKIAQQIHHNKPPSSSKHTFSTLGQKTCQGRRRVFMFSWMRSMLRLKLRSERNSAGFFCCDPQTWMFPSWIFTCLKRWNFKAWKNLEILWKLGGMAKQKTISAFVSCWTQTFGLLDIEHFRTWIDWGYHYLCRSNKPQAVTLTDVPIKQQKRASDIISSMKSKNFMNYGHSWRINKLPLEPKNKLSISRIAFLFRMNILGAPSHFLATCWFPKSRIVALSITETKIKAPRLIHRKQPKKHQQGPDGLLPRNWLL